MLCVTKLTDEVLILILLDAATVLCSFSRQDVSSLEMVLAETDVFTAGYIQKLNIGVCNYMHVNNKSCPVLLIYSIQK